MPAGKLAVQVAHAAVGAVFSVEPNDPRLLPWKNGRFTKVCVEVNSEAEIRAIEQQAKDAGLITCLITDAGFTVFKEPTVTCLAIGPDALENVNAITGNLPLYKTHWKEHNEPVNYSIESP